MALVSYPRTLNITSSLIFSSLEGLLITLAFGILQVQVIIETNQLEAGLVRSQLGWPLPWREVWFWSKCEGIDCTTLAPSGIVNWTFLLSDFLIFTAVVFLTIQTYQKLIRKRPSD